MKTRESNLKKNNNYKKMNGNTQLTIAKGYDVKRMVFSKPEVNSVPGTPISYKRINIGTVNPDGSQGELIMSTSRLFSFGVSENTSVESGAVNGYTLPLCLWTKDAPTDEEKAWTTTFNNIVDNCIKHILSIKDDIEKYDLEERDLKKLNPLYWKREKGKIVEGQGPTLYAKLIESKKNNKILTNFYNAETGEDIDPMSLKGKYCYVDAAVKLESIYIGNRISLQVKLYEAGVKLLESGPKRLLSRPAYIASVSMGAGPSQADDDAPVSLPKPVKQVTKPAPPPAEEIPDEESGGDDDEDDAPPPPPKPVAAAGVRKVIAAKRK